jgi:anthranilate synthase component 1
MAHTEILSHSIRRTAEYFPSFTEFCRKAGEGNLIPVYREIMADMETPVSAVLKLRDDEYVYLLEGVQRGERWPRYSFLGSNPMLVVRSLRALRQVMARYAPARVAGLPRFCGGAVGYFTYGPGRNPTGPDLLFMVTDTVLIFDHLTNTITVASHAHLGGQTARAAYEQAVARIDLVTSRLRRPSSAPVAPPPGAPLHVDADLSESNLSNGQFGKTCDPFRVYRALRLIDPSPYMSYLKFGDLTLIGSSPAVLMRCDEGRVGLGLIGGTGWREGDSAAGAALLEELRKNLGRVCRPETITVKEPMPVEQRPHVLHPAPHLEGILHSDRTAYDALEACVPADTFSRSPTIGASQVAVGYFGFSGNMAACVDIQTMVVKGRRAYVQAGARVAADSHPLAAAIEFAENGLT